MTNTSTASERSDDRIATTEACPACGHKGRQVKRVTLESLLRPERRPDIAEGPYHVCTTPDCETVYFSPDGGATFCRSDLIVRFGLKEASPPRPVCYCFDHSIEGIHDEIRHTGKSTVVASIKTDMQGPACRCEYTNPLGACCLSSVHAVVAEGFRRVGRAAHEDGRAAEEPLTPARGVADCCALKDGGRSAPKA